jgi:hypothetical protein
MVEWVVGGLLGFVWLFFVLLAIMRVAQSAASTLTKVIWIVVLVCLPVIGLIAWLLIGPGSVRHNPSVRQGGL